MNPRLQRTKPWLSVREAAAILGIPVITLRRAIERNARQAGGHVQASLDGVDARKFGRRWRVALDRGWLDPGRRTG